jgi:hypothetical protein
LSFSLTLLFFNPINKLQALVLPVYFKNKTLKPSENELLYHPNEITTMNQTSLLNIDDPNYRNHVLSYLFKYYFHLIKPEHARLLKPTIHVSWHAELTQNGFTPPPKMATLEEMIATGSDPMANREKYQLDEVDLAPWEPREKWPGYGWMNYNFLGPADELRFSIMVCNLLITEHHEEIWQHACTACGKLMRTPKTKVCMWCIPERPLKAPVKTKTNRAAVLRKFLEDD